jgi:protein-disulfide isomerase
MQLPARASKIVTSIALLGAMVTLAACNNAGPPGGGAGALSKYEVATDISTGSKDAKVVLVEYASVTCSHCANFHNKVLPTIKEKYVTPGKVRIVYREFPTSPVELAMAGHAIARCAGGEKRDLVISTIMRQQMELFTQAQGPTGADQYFKTLAASVGMNEAAYKACLSNEEVLKTLVAVKEGGDKAGVQGTPAFFINGVRFEGPGGREIEAKDMIPALDAAIAKAG